MSDESFLRPHLTGARFAGHSIPLEFLKDLAVLQEMIIEVAKWKFLQDNPGRQRCPRGFTKGVELRLANIQEGSAALEIVVVTPTPAQSVLPAMPSTPSTILSYLNKARDAVACAVDSAEQNTPITGLDEKHFGYFDLIGRSLRDGEAIEFPTPGRTERSRLTKESRRRLVLASSQVREFTESTVARGRICEADQDKMSFMLQFPDGRRVSAPMAAQHLDTILEAFKGYKQDARVMLEGIGRFSREGRLQSIESVEHITPLDALDVPARIDELSCLKDGWLEGGGIAPPREGLAWLGDSLETHFAEEIPLPYLYPTEGGGIQAEWAISNCDVSLEIELSSRTAEWHCLNMNSDEEATKTLNLNEDGDWEWLVSELRTLAGGEA